jgi:hypothetical protein
MAPVTFDWIVCRGAERQVADGRVACPAFTLARTRTVQLDECLDCRHLIATPIDRLPQGMCSTGEQLPVHLPEHDLL